MTRWCAVPVQSLLAGVLLLAGAGCDPDTPPGNDTGAGAATAGDGITAEEAWEELEVREAGVDAEAQGVGEGGFPTSADPGTGDLTAQELESIWWQEIYGQDLPTVEPVVGSGLEDLASGVCIVVRRGAVSYDAGTHEYVLQTRTADLSRVMTGMGTEEIVADSLLGTGFLVGAAMVVTAGHVLDCDISGSAFLFGFADSANGAIRTRFPPEDVAWGKCYDATREDMPGGDWSIVRVEPATASGIDPERHRVSTGEMAAPVPGHDAAALGHPWGLPVRVVKGGRVREQGFALPWFTSSLRLYRGNSGSPILGNETLIGVHSADSLHSSVIWLRGWLDGTLVEYREGQSVAAVRAEGEHWDVLPPGGEIHYPSPPGTAIQLLNVVRGVTRVTSLPPARVISLREVDEQGGTAITPTGRFQVIVKEGP